MPTIPLGLESYSRSDGLVPEVVLKNLYMETSGSGEDKMIYRLQRPGLRSLVELPAPVNGLFQQDGLFNGATFATSNNQLFRINIADATTTVLGTLDDNGRTQFAASNEKIGMVTSSGFWVYTGDAIVKVNIPEPRFIPISVTSINGFFVIGTSTGRFYVLRPGTNVIDPLDFFTAESNPDSLVGVLRVKDELRFYGTDSVEVWYQTGDNDVLFQRATGRDFDTGCLNRDTIALFDNSVMWVSNDGIVYREDNVPLRISNTGIEERLRKREADPTAFTYGIDGHLFYVLRIPGQGTFAYDAMTQYWSEFSSRDETYWLPHLGIRVGSVVVTASSDSGEVWILDQEQYVDDVDGDSRPIDRVVSGSLIFADSKPLPNYDVSFVAATSDPSIEFYVRWRDGSGPYSQPRILRPSSNRNVMAAYRLGEARQPIRTFEFSTSADANVAIYSAAFGQAWRR